MKRKLTLRVNGEEITVTAHREGDSIVIDRDGRTYEVQVVGQSLVVPDASVVQAPIPAAAGPAPASPAASPPQRRSAPAAAGPGAVIAPMVGVVKEVVVASGAAVKAGDKVIVLEAMKMDIDVVSPTDGTVAEVSVSAGDSVTEGQQLVRVEA